MAELSAVELQEFVVSLTEKGLSANSVNGVITVLKSSLKRAETLGVFEMRPGISCYAQVHGRDDVYYKNKAILDAEYVQKASLRFDFKLMVACLLNILKLSNG